MYSIQPAIQYRVLEVRGPLPQEVRVDRGSGALIRKVSVALRFRELQFVFSIGIIRKVIKRRMQSIIKTWIRGRSTRHKVSTYRLKLHQSEYWLVVCGTR